MVRGIRSDLREVLLTRVMDAEPDHKELMPDPSIWPFLSAVAVTGLFIGSIFTPWAVPIGSIPATAAIIAWVWPRRKEHQEEVSAERDQPPGLSGSALEGQA